MKMRTNRPIRILPLIQNFCSLVQKGAGKHVLLHKNHKYIIDKKDKMLSIHNQEIHDFESTSSFFL